MNCIRGKSKKGEYHVILNFIKELRVFSNRDERREMEKILKIVMRKMKCKIYAHTIMLNHVHLLIKEGKEYKLPSIVISISTRFAKFYNKYHQRKGRVFSRRYNSKPVRNDSYFFIVFRYILRNPVKAGLLENPWDYEWSSAKDYLKRDGPFFQKEVLDRYYKQFFDASISIEEYVGQKGDDALILDIEKKRYYEKEAREIYLKELNSLGINDLKNHTKRTDKKEALLRMRQTGLTFVQMKYFSGMAIKDLKTILYF